MCTLDSLGSTKQISAAIVGLFYQSSGLLTVHFCTEYYSDPVLAKEIAATLSKVMVRNEFCQDFVDMGGFTALREAVSAHTAIVVSQLLLY